MSGHVESINVGMVRTIEHRGRSVTSGIVKVPVRGPVKAAGINLDGDHQADRRAHGGIDKAVYAYASEDYRWWETALDRRLEPGVFGENLTTVGVNVCDALIGDRWQIGTATFEVSEPRIACAKLAMALRLPGMSRRFSRADRPGAYLRIVEPGVLSIGDPVTVVETTSRSLSVSDVARIYDRHRDESYRLLDVDTLSLAWREWARQTIALRRSHGLV